jgi:hypothetical protein
MRARLLVLMLAACAGPRVEAPRRDLASLPAPHRTPLAIKALRDPVDLQARIGARDKRDSIEAVLAWTGELGVPIEATSHEELLAWAERAHRLRAADETPRPGDLLVFDRVDLVGVAIAHARGITEFVYLAGGVVRRGFVDARRPTRKRDEAGSIVNTHVRHGKRKGSSRYLAGQLLSNVIRTR